LHNRNATYHDSSKSVKGLKNILKISPMSLSKVAFKLTKPKLKWLNKIYCKFTIQLTLIVWQWKATQDINTLIVCGKLYITI